MRQWRHTIDEECGEAMGCAAWVPAGNVNVIFITFGEDGRGPAAVRGREPMRRQGAPAERA